MKSYPTLRRWLAAGLTAGIFAIVVVGVAWSTHSADGAKGSSTANDAKAGHGWRMFGGTFSRNFVNTFDRSIASDWSIEPGSEKHIQWSADLGSKAYGGPVIAGGKVFIGTNNKKPRNPRDIDPVSKQPLDKGILMCFRESDGKFLWQAVHDKLAAGRVNDWPEEGICSSPTVEGNRLYYVSNRCELICADTEGFLDGKNDGVQDEHYKTPTDADIIWRLDMMKELNVFPHNLADCSPLVVGDRIYVVTSNGVDEGHINIPCPAAPSFIAVDKKTGKVLWQKNYPTMNLLKPGANLKELVDRGQVLMHGQWSNPVYAEVNGKAQVIFPGGDGWLYALEPETGDIIWRFDCNPKGSIYQLGTKGTRSDFVATPVVYDNKVYIGVGQDPEHKEGVGHLWCIDLTKRGDVSPVNNDFNPADPVNKGSALVWHYGGPAPEGSDRNYLFGRTMSSCAVHDGLVYVAELAGYIHCLDAKTGQKYWDHDMGAATWCSPYWVDGKIYIGNDNGELLVFAHGKEKKLLSTINMEGKIRATPVAANGVLYVMTENKLYAVK
jgi:outer membrane protein assembly factor BamB